MTTTPHRLIAPPHLRGTPLQFSDGWQIEIPRSGTLEVGPSRDWSFPGTIESGEPHPQTIHQSHYVRELLQLCFRHIEAAGPTGERPCDGYPGEPYFDTSIGSPLWWHGGAWRDATGAAR
jgi:hypothetical protein